VMLGTGVDDPDFYGPLSWEARMELERWREILPRFEHLAVRGPLSQARLAEAGFSSEVVGDTALILADARPSPNVH
ncbi:polysaccharide pyruvyl transferase family protein, partial [Escherichia coli]